METRPLLHPPARPRAARRAAPVRRRSAGARGPALRRLAAAAALAAAGCGGEPPAFLVEARVSPTPATVGRARVLVEVRTPDGRPVEGARVAVTPVDPSGTAGARVEAEAGAPGLWVADPVGLPAAGAWTLAVEVTGPDGTVVLREAPLHVVGPPPGEGRAPDQGRGGSLHAGAAVGRVGAGARVASRASARTATASIAAGSMGTWISAGP